MARAGPSGAAASGEATPHASPETHRQTAAPQSPPLPTNSVQFNFSCRCLNVQVNGRIPNEVGEKINARPADVQGEDLHQVYLGEKTEDLKFPLHVTFDQRDEEEERISQVDQGDEPRRDLLPPSWRTCWICGVRCYQVPGKLKLDPPAEDQWVNVDIGSGIRYGTALDAALSEPALPFSSLLLETPTSSSAFGRPPQSSFPSALYPIAPRSPAPPSSKSVTLIPPMPDPFFLPPPFVPSHPHLRDLCDQAVTHLKERHALLEDEVKTFIADKAQEMRGLEEKVRCEVELLWERYRDGPGQGDNRGLSRSVSLTRTSEARARSRDRSQAFSPPLSPRRSRGEETNPIALEASRAPAFAAPPGSSSLLSMSFSANAISPPPPPVVPPRLDDAIDKLAKDVGKSDDQRAVAMSHMFSVLDDAMAANHASRMDAKKQRKASGTLAAPAETRPAPAPDEQAVTSEDVHGKDSWIDSERALANRMLAKDAKLGEVIEEEIEGRTPRPRTVKELQPVGKDKGKSKVTFEEPKPEEKEHEHVQPNGKAEDDEEYVFDFELEDSSPEPRPMESPAEYPEGTIPVDISRTRNIVEANLSTTFAADAPSHRAAWRRIQQNSSIYAAIQRRPSDASGSDYTSVDGAVSKLAVSMPLNIAIPLSRLRTTSQQPPLERKTSLSDREGMLVPPLMAAMRERGIPANNSLGLDVPSASPSLGQREGITARRGSRSASVSREREQVKSFKADPGAVFESLVDDDDDEEEDEEEGEQGGTLRNSRTFVPPHVLARKDSAQQPDVGWRSMVSD